MVQARVLAGRPVLLAVDLSDKHDPEFNPKVEQASCRSQNDRVAAAQAIIGRWRGLVMHYYFNSCRGLDFSFRTWRGASTNRRCVYRTSTPTDKRFCRDEIPAPGKSAAEETTEGSEEIEYR